MAKILFKMSDKSLLLKLHAAALKASSFDKDGGFDAKKRFALLNSGLADGKQLKMLDDAGISKIAQKDSSSIKYFSSKDGTYEVGVAALEDATREARSASSGLFKQSQLETPEKAYEAFAADNGTDRRKLDKLKEEAYKAIVSYMSAFCGEAYARSVPKDKVKCEAYRSLDEVLETADGVIGNQARAVGSAEVKVLLFKIGYTVGAKKV